MSAKALFMSVYMLRHIQLNCATVYVHMYVNGAHNDLQTWLKKKKKKKRHQIATF